MKAYLMFVFLLAGCGVDLKVKQRGKIESDSKVGPDFVGAAAFCDTRYSANSLAAEDCFSDYRSYFDVNIGLDVSSLIDYCTAQYGQDLVAQQQCVADLTSLFEEAMGGQEEEEP